MKHYFVRGQLFRCADSANYAGLDYLTDEQEAFLAAHPNAKPHEVRFCILDKDRPTLERQELITEQQHETDV